MSALRNSSASRGGHAVPERIADPTLAPPNVARKNGCQDSPDDPELPIPATWAELSAPCRWCGAEWPAQCDCNQIDGSERPPVADLCFDDEEPQW